VNRRTVAQPETEFARDRAAALGAIANARSDPRFYIVDRDLRVVSASHGMTDASQDGLPPDVHTAVASLLERRPGRNAPLVTALRGDSILRLVPADGREPLFVIFVSQARNPLALAAKRYGFTSREIEVLELLMPGRSSTDIAAHLQISHLTVLQHIRNVGHKMGISKRKEIVAALLGVS
jgi:DNA-binding CsgD family transcriptional regulator